LSRYTLVRQRQNDKQPIARTDPRQARTASGASTARLTTDTALALMRLARRYGITRHVMLERLIAATNGKIVSRLDPASAEWNAYFIVTP
jgi:hypothetical protein